MHDSGAHFLLSQSLAAKVALNSRTQTRQVSGHLPDSVVFPQLTLLDRAPVVLVLLAPSVVESPHLDRSLGVGRDVHVTPCGRDSERVYALELRPLRDSAAGRPLVPESLRLRAFTNDPLSRHLSVAHERIFLVDLGSRRRAPAADNLPTNSCACPSSS